MLRCRQPCMRGWRRNCRCCRAFAGIPGVPVAGNATGVAPLGGIAASIFAAMTQVCEASSLPVGCHAHLLQSFFRPASSELLLTGPLSGLAALSGVGGLMILNAAGVLPISLAALAALALPGVGGLPILTAAGVRVGYRQAKAGFALRTAGIARFARPGAVPLGVVRSGSLVVVRPRALRVVRPGALSAGVFSIKSPSSRRPGLNCRLDGRRPGGGHRCEALDAESISIVIFGDCLGGLGARHK